MNTVTAGSIAPGSITAGSITAAVKAWTTQVLGHSLLAWLVALGIALVASLLVRQAVRLARRIVLPRAEKRNSNALRSLAAALGAVRGWLLVVIAIAVALDSLRFGDRADYWLGLLVFTLVGVQLVLCANRILVTLLLRSVAPGTPVPVMLSIVTWAVQLVVWTTFLLALLSNAGVHITAFVASLGVGGIAVALALQNILGDLFASVAIGLDKPFEPGDFITFGDSSGTVRRVGVKTTRIASISGEELAIANSVLLGQLTHNYSRMPERRVVFGFTVPYATTRTQLREITERTNAIIQATDQVRFDRGHFTGFGDDGFTFEFVYYVLDPDYTLYMDIQQSIDGQIIEVLESLGVPFAVPARSVAMASGSVKMDG